MLMIDLLTDVQLAHRTATVKRMVERAGARDLPTLDRTLKALVGEKVRRDLLKAQESRYSN